MENKRRKDEEEMAIVHELKREAQYEKTYSE